MTDCVRCEEAIDTNRDPHVTVTVVFHKYNELTPIGASMCDDFRSAILVDLLVEAGGETLDELLDERSSVNQKIVPSTDVLAF